MSLSAANDHASLPIAYRLYLPEIWANDTARHDKTGIPDDIMFETKPRIALGQIRSALQAGVSPATVLMDAGYGVDTDFRDGITELGLCYVGGIQSSTGVWAPGTAPRPPKRSSGHGRPPTLMRRDVKHKPVAAKELALTLPREQWHRLTWREGSNAKLTSRFAAERVRPAHRDYNRANPRAEEGCLIKWPNSAPSI